MEPRGNDFFTSIHDILQILDVLEKISGVLFMIKVSIRAIIKLFKCFASTAPSALYRRKHQRGIKERRSMAIPESD